MKDQKESKESFDGNEVEFTKELDKEALDVIKRLYDKTFKELVDR